LGEQGILANRGFWGTSDFGEQGMLANRGFWGTRDFGEQGILGNKGCWRTGDFGEQGVLIVEILSSGRGGRINQQMVLHFVIV